MKKASLSELKGYFIRPASITFRFTDAQEKAYRAAADAYNSILPYTKATSVEMPEAASYYYYQFHVNQGASSRQDIELRLEHRQRDSSDLENRTIIYWEIEEANLDFIKEKLLSLSYRLLEEDKITAKGQEAQRFIAQSPTGNLIAGHTNPPFPFVKHSRRQRLLGEGLAPKTSATAKLLAGISLGSVLLGAAALLRSRRR